MLAPAEEQYYDEAWEPRSESLFGILPYDPIDGTEQQSKTG